MPNFGLDGIDALGAGAVLERAFRRKVRAKEHLGDVQRYNTSLEGGVLRLLSRYDELQAREVW